MVNRKDETKDYLVDALIDFDAIRKKYPTLKFYAISTRTFLLQVSPEATDALEQFKEDVQSVFVPILYGLNIQNALDASNINFFHNYPLGELRGKDVIVGIIDTGIDYTNEVFKYEDNTTRILTLWDQTIEGDGVPGFDYGTLYTESQINEALKSDDPLSIVPSTDDNGHGTFLAGVAAGFDRSSSGSYIGAAPDALLSIVKLRPAKQYLREFYLVNEGAVAYQDTDFLTGINHLIRVAREQKKPLSICCGLGCNFGGHDGNTVAERYLGEATSFEDIIITLSAGNEASFGHHYEDTVLQNGTKTFELNVSENEEGFIMNVWANMPDKIAISVISPLGNVIEKIPISNKNQEFKFPLEPTRIIVRYFSPDINSGDELIALRLEKPTPGIWQFTVYGEKIVDGTFNSWVSREGFSNLNTRFLKPESFGTICIPATSRETLAIGAYNDIDNSIYVSSGRGPTRSQSIKPDLVAPGVNIRGPWNDGTFKRQTGTSISAAITTGACALLLEWSVIKGNLPSMNTRVARSILIRGANRDIGIVYPNNISGYGRLDLQNSITSI